jgi:hypothetical protein
MMCCCQPSEILLRLFEMFVSSKVATIQSGNLTEALDLTFLDYVQIRAELAQKCHHEYFQDTPEFGSNLSVFEVSDMPLSMHCRNQVARLIQYSVPRVHVHVREYNQVCVSVFRMTVTSSLQRMCACYDDTRDSGAVNLLCACILVPYMHM